MYLECSLNGNVLHSHNGFKNTTIYWLIRDTFIIIHHYLKAIQKQFKRWFHFRVGLDLNMKQIDYIYQNFDLVKLQLFTAGVRLADTLNDIFDE